MTLKCRLGLNAMFMLAGVLALAGLALWSLAGLNADLNEAQRQFDRLKAQYRVGVAVVRAREALRGAQPRLAQARSQLTTAQLRLRRLTSPGSPSEPAAPSPGESDSQTLRSVQSHLDRAASALASDGTPTPSDALPIERAIGALNQALGAIAGAGQRARVRIDTMQRAAVNRFQATAGGVMALAGGIVLLATGFTWLQYRAVMQPVRRLRDGVHRLAAGELSHRLDQRGDRELAELSRALNWMASELETLYHQLESRVRQQSAQLARSERLASVGFLAAGVSHELNNPLAIISHQAELAERRANGRADASDDAPLARPSDTDQQHSSGAYQSVDQQQAWQLVREEAQRCQRITERLLSVAGRSAVQTEPVDAIASIRESIDIARRLRPDAEQPISVETASSALEQVGSSGPLHVQAEPVQLRQVLVNLLVNALDATDRAAGQVTVQATCDGQRARIAVADNGQGMAPATLERVFEPLYTTKTGRQHAGTGLGLSLCQTIADQFNGALNATSPGIGQGSVFTLELPLAANGARPAVASKGKAGDGESGRPPGANGEGIRSEGMD